MANKLVRLLQSFFIERAFEHDQDVDDRAKYTSHPGWMSLCQWAALCHALLACHVCSYRHWSFFNRARFARRDREADYSLRNKRDGHHRVLLRERRNSKEDRICLCLRLASSNCLGYTQHRLLVDRKYSFFQPRDGVFVHMLVWRS